MTSLNQDEMKSMDQNEQTMTSLSDDKMQSQDVGMLKTQTGLENRDSIDTQTSLNNEDSMQTMTQMQNEESEEKNFMEGNKDNRLQFDSHSMPMNLEIQRVPEIIRMDERYD